MSSVHRRTLSGDGAAAAKAQNSASKRQRRKRGMVAGLEGGGSSSFLRRGGKSKQGKDRDERKKADSRRIGWFRRQLHDLAQS
ncbi:hypothetical protein [Chromobacterium sp.]|uniref:hypothetical protein n=1 Tax=Chromobacterium sp. TaxID=306190 RepID=UPI0035B430C1